MAGWAPSIPQADDLWDAYQNREVEGPSKELGAGNVGWKPKSGMGAGGVEIDGEWHEELADPGEGSYDSASDYNAASAQLEASGGWGENLNTHASESSGTPLQQAQQGQNMGITPAEQARLAIDAARQQTEALHENNRHSEVMADLEQKLAIHKDELAYKYAVQQENIRHNQAVEENERERLRVQERMNQLDNATKVKIQAMADEAAKQLEMMKEAHALMMQNDAQGQEILMAQGGQAFADWQKRQENLMGILGSALNNPWLQQLSGMAPPGQESAIMGGGNIQALLQKVLAPFDYTKAFGAQSQAVGPGATDALNQYAGMEGGGEWQQGPGQETYAPSYGDWQSWSPFKKAAYRADIEALGPGAWQTQQQAAQNRFVAEGGSPDVTPLAGMSASPTEHIGQQMTANMFGQTADQWQQGQQRQWSQAQAPQVKQTLSTGVAQQTPTKNAAPESQFL